MKDKDGDGIPTVPPWPGSVQWNTYRQKKFVRAVSAFRKQVETVINQHITKLLKESKGDKLNG